MSSLVKNKKGEISPEIWEAELELLKFFTNICEKENIKYFASGGTCLGAVRHQGFIPWDDDIDIEMLRSDFEKFKQVVSKYLPSYYEFQEVGTGERYYETGLAKIRDSRTTCFTKWDYPRLKDNWNCGVFLDIFPLDALPNDLKERKAFITEVEAKRKYLINNHYNTKITNKDYTALWEDFYIFCQKYNNTDAKDVSFVTWNTKFIFSKAYYTDAVILPFENLMISCPKDYNSYLIAHYGKSYMTPVKAPSFHGQVYFDCKKSYKEYKNITKQDFDWLFGKRPPEVKKDIKADGKPNTYLYF